MTNATVTVIGGLTQSAVLVDLTISEWTGRKLDKKSTDKVVSDNNASSKDAARVTKHLFVENPLLENIHRAAGAARNYLGAHTLPWMGDLKLLPMSKFIKFQEDMGELKAQFHDAVDAFLKDYNVQVSAMAFKLGDLFKREEYPDAQELRTKFRFSWNLMPLPTSGDFRVEAEQVLIQSMQEQYEALMNDRINDCMTTVTTRLKETLTHLVDRLAINDSGKPNIFRDSMLENAKELVNLLRDFNITNDPALETARKALAATIDGVEPEELRKNLDIREEVRSNVADILDRFKW